MMTTETAIALLRAALKPESDTDLMNQLQDQGLVSDEAVFLTDCAGVDLRNACEELVPGTRIVQMTQRCPTPESGIS